MPTCDYHCRLCDHRFTRVVMRGEACPAAPCPVCGQPVAPTPLRSTPLFDGIAGFSDLARDTN